MADPVPSTDPALLAAQAKAGQAGVDAYKAAQAALTTQRQTAVQGAMQEAALRGSPAEAMQQVQSTITAPYDQRIASLEQGGAAFTADLAARDRRLADYNAAVLAARAYLPEQANLVTAPIRAEADFRVRGIQMEGEQKVAAIDAERRLMEAKMAAALAAAAGRGGGGGGRGGGGGGGGGSKKPNKTELESQLFSRAKARVQTSAQAVRDVVKGNQAKVAAQTKAPIKSIRTVQGRADRTASNARVNATQAASYIAKGVAAAEGQRVSAAPARTPFMPRMGPATTARDAQTAAVRNAIGRVTGLFGGGGRTTTGGRGPAKALDQIPWSQLTGEAQIEREQRLGNRGVVDSSGRLDTGAGQRRETRSGISASLSPAAGRKMSALALSPATSAIARLQGQAKTSMANQGRMAYDYARQIANLQRTATEPFMTRFEGGGAAMLSPDQLEMFDEFDRDAIVRAAQQGGPGGGLRSSADVDRVLLGAPGERGYSDPFSGQLMRDAMVQSAQEMIEEGYDINEDDVLNAIGEAEMYKPGESLYNVMARQSGQPTGEEEYRISEDIEADRIREENRAYTLQGRQGSGMEAELDADDNEAALAISSRYGKLPSSSYGTPGQILSRISAGSFADAETALDQILTQRGTSDISEVDDLDDALSDMGVTQADRKLLRELYS